MSRHGHLVWFLFFFLCLGIQRGWEFVFMPHAGTSLSVAVAVFNEAVVATFLLLLLRVSPKAAYLALGALSVLYLVSEHHLFVQGDYLQPQILVDYPVLSPQLYQGYSDNLRYPLALTSLAVFLSTVLLLAQRLPLRHKLPAPRPLSRPTTAFALGSAVFGIVQLNSSGPLPAFVTPLANSMLTQKEPLLAHVQPGAFLQHSIFDAPPVAHVKPVSSNGMKMNVIIIHLESTGYISSRFNGETMMSSMRRLAAHGITWPNAYAPAPHTAKSIFAYQTGKYGPVTTSNPIPEVSPDRQQCIAKNFKTSGYRTAFFSADYFHFYNTQALNSFCAYDTMRDARTIGSTDPSYVNAMGTDEAALFDAGLKFAKAGEAPFFMVLETVLPHWPYKAPAAWMNPTPEKADRLSQYRNSLSYVDGALSRFLDELEAAGLLKNTVIVAFGDHGEAFNEHENNLIHGKELFEENVRIPMVLSSPGLFPGAWQADSLASIVDVPPTLYKLLGIDWDPAKHDGVSMLDIPSGRMVFMICDALGFKYAIRDGDYKFITAPAAKKSWLYNLREDPHERKNIADSSTERVSFYSGAIQSWIAHTTDLGQPLGGASP